jgi:hypothetical protein
MTRCAVCLIVLLAWTATLAVAEEKAILSVMPTLAELGDGWTTNLVAYLIDPRSSPPEIDYQGNPATSPRLDSQRLEMRVNGRTGCGLLFYGRGNLTMNSGLYRVYIQRWNDRRALHNDWVTWKMNPARVVRDMPAVGEDYFWIEEWWRETRLRQNLVFRRGLFHVTIEAGADSDWSAMVRLAQVIDGKIRGKATVTPAATAP